MEGFAAPIFADGVHFPLSGMAVEFGHDHCCMGALAVELIARYLLLCTAVHQAAIGILHPVKCMPGKAVDHKNQKFDPLRNHGQIDQNLFIVALSSTGDIITGMLNGAIAAVQLLEPDSIHNLVVLIKQQTGGIQVDFIIAAEKAQQAARFFYNIPTQAHDHLLQGLSRLLVQADFLSFTQINAHSYSFLHDNQASTPK